MSFNSHSFLLLPVSGGHRVNSRMNLPAIEGNCEARSFSKFTLDSTHTASHPPPPFNLVGAVAIGRTRCYQITVTKRQSERHKAISQPGLENDGMSQTAPVMSADLRPSAESPQPPPNPSKWRSSREQCYTHQNSPGRDRNEWKANTKWP